jgi:hypothetical protein
MKTNLNLIEMRGFEKVGLRGQIRKQEGRLINGKKGTGTGRPVS